MFSYQVRVVGDFCNLRCTYCRNRDFDQKTPTIMSEEVLKRFLEFGYLDRANQIRIVWHGGEPLTAGINFFRSVSLNEQKLPGKKWKNGIQTNATLIDSEWSKFFKASGFNISVSIDGNKKTHDLNRVNISGTGSFDQAIKGLEQLRKNGIYPSVICTITKETYNSAKEILESLVALEFKNIAFNAFYNTATEKAADKFALNEKEWSSFLVEIFEIWLEIDNPAIHVREIDESLAWLKNKCSSSCSFRGTCTHWLTVDSNGEMYPCERIGKQIKLGNIFKTPNPEILQNSYEFKKWENTTKIIPEKCKSCDFQGLCHNGCVAHRNQEGDSFPLFTYCESRLSLNKYLKHRLNL
jgi:uncharacterized protein